MTIENWMLSDIVINAINIVSTRKLFAEPTQLSREDIHQIAGRVGEETRKDIIDDMIDLLSIAKEVAKQKEAQRITREEACKKLKRNK